MSKWTKVGIVLALAACCLSCDTSPGTATPTQQIVTQNVIINPPSSSPGPGVSPSPGATCGTVAAVRLGFFGVRCPSGVPTPRNQEGILPLGCLGDVTATPKDNQNADVLPAVHGQNIVWRVEAGAGLFDLNDDASNAFNKTVRPITTGVVVLSATVTPPGCGAIRSNDFTFRITN